MHVIIAVTCPDDKTAEHISESVLRERLAACVNTISGIKSRYWWKGRIEGSEECMLLIKTRKALFRKVEKAVKENHPYDIPEVIAIPIGSGSKDYLSWIDSETGKR